MNKPNRPVLNHTQFFNLCSWLQSADLSKTYTFVELAKQATQELRFYISVNAAKKALNATNIVLPPVPVVAKTAPYMRTDRVRALAFHVRVLYEKLGEPIPEDLQILCMGHSVNKSEAES